MKKRMVKMLAVFSIVTLGVGCSSPAKETAVEKEATSTETKKNEGETNKDTPVKLKIAMWDAYDENKSHVKVANEYTKKTGVEFEWVCVTDGYDQKMVTATAAGNAPDLVLYWDTPKYVESGIIQDITDLVERDNYNPEGKYKLAETFEKYNGGYYGLTGEMTPRAIYYNKDIFDQLGVPYPQDGWTWDEFYETAKQLTAGQGDDATFGYVALAGHAYLMQQYIWSNGGDLCSEDGKDAIGYMDSQAVIDTVNWYKKLYDISAQVVQNDGMKNLGETEFMTGKVAMMDNGVWPAYKMKEQGINFGVVTPPVPKRGDTFMPVIHSGAFGISPNTKYREEAWEFLKYCQTTEGQQYYSETSIPINKQAAEEAGLFNDDVLKEFLKLCEMDSKYPCFTRNPKWAEAEAEFSLALERVLLENVDPVTELQEAAKNVDAILKED